MNRIAARVSRLERFRRVEERPGEPGRPWWWELPPDQWAAGRIGIGHEDALRELDADPEHGGDGTP